MLSQDGDSMRLCRDILLSSALQASSLLHPCQGLCLEHARDPTASNHVLAVNVCLRVAALTTATLYAKSQRWSNTGACTGPRLGPLWLRPVRASIAASQGWYPNECALHACGTFFNCSNRRSRCMRGCVVMLDLCCFGVVARRMHGQSVGQVCIRVCANMHAAVLCIGGYIC